jgi:uncharacterized repeat protein (TIGR01451 family)
MKYGTTMTLLIAVLICLIPFTGTLTVNASINQIPSIAAGAYHRLGLKSDGTVIAVGLNNHGQYNVNSTSDKIVFSSQRIEENQTVICIMNSDGTNQTRLTYNTGLDWEPHLSSDGKRIVFTSGRDGNEEIYVMNSDGNNQVRLTNNTSWDGEPKWSPDGTKIVFTSKRDGNTDEIYVMNADGSGQTRLTENTITDFSPSWAPDGSKIIFSSTRAGGSYQLFVMNPDGSAPTRITYTATWDYQAAWSPDGTKIAFTAGPTPSGPIWRIYIINSDGSNPRLLTTNTDEEHATWSPEGNRIAFSSPTLWNTAKIYCINLDGTNQITLTNNIDSDFRPEWGPALPIADLRIVKTDSPEPVTAGTDITYTITATNNGPAAANSIIATDTLTSAGSFKFTFKADNTHGKGTYNSNSGVWSGFDLAAGETATLDLIFSVNAATADGTVITNTANITGNEIDPNTANNTSSCETTVIAPVLKMTKIAKLAKDADGDGDFSPGDTIKYIADISNDGNGAAVNAAFTDTPDMNTKLVVGSVTASQGFVSKGNIAGNIVEVSLGTIPGQGKATITFDVTINKPLWEIQITNQGVLKGANFVSLISDDPSTTDLPDDPTITKIKTSPPVHGPSISEWGVIALTTLLGGGIVWLMRRKQIRSEIS